MNSPTPNELAELLPYLTQQERDELDRLLLQSQKWIPLPGPQSQAYECDADLILYGGAAGGGKSDLALGKALTKHRRSLILRREFPQLEGMVERSKEMFSAHGSYNEKGWWRCNFEKKSRFIRFGSVQHEKDLKKLQGRPHDLLVFDEAANFPAAFVQFLTTWIRTEHQDQKCQLLLCSNPPTDPEGDWLLEWFAPWLDPNHPNQAKPGELRWYIIVGDEHIEVDSPAPVKRGEETYTPQSRTFIPARVTDNPYYAGTGYVAKLQALPEPLRSKMLKGDFAAGREDSAFQVIPSAWVKAAQERWKQREKPKTPMTAIGVDVARGGKDKTVATPRFDNYFDTPVCEPGQSTPNGQAVATLVMNMRRDDATVNIDIGGVGTSPYDVLAEKIGMKAVAMNGAEGSDARDKSGQLAFVNARAEWYWKLREALDPVGGDELAIPPDPELLADLTTPRWKLTARGIQIEAKEEIIKRIKRSPDKGDSLVYAHAIKIAPGTGLFAFMQQQAADAEAAKKAANGNK
ncbi:terminase [Burkholderia pseudomallei]|nr:terminase [Burkholderia pseudomallei]MBF3906470.1 terminase [Burkholderia pseudomallei]MCE2035809.1 terminase family protein [Burkholderia pseudomallei CS]MCE2041817.1 terminase family protein [Burkholderia pseudomallei CB]QFS13052.1 terminase [Burkholderia pseudomallei]